MERLVALLLACSGCDGLFGLTRDGYSDAGTADALDGRAIDADSARPCAGRSPVPLFCFDFDGPALVGYESGTEFPLQVTAFGVIVDRRPPSTTGERALWLTSTGVGQAVAFRDNPGVMLHRIEGRFSMRGTAAPSAARNMELFRVAVEGGGTCHSALRLSPISMDLVFDVSCGGSTTETVIGMLTDAWHRYELTFDAVTGVGSASIDGGPALMVPLTAQPGYSMPPSMMFGLIGTDPDISIGFDDIDVTGM
jgi:hypothetical protein